MSNPKLVLTLYISHTNPELDSLIAQLCEALIEEYDGSGAFEINVINVLKMPEKAVANDVFVTPTLVREVPEPVIKVLGTLAKTKEIITAITSNFGDEPETLVV